MLLCPLFCCPPFWCALTFWMNNLCARRFDTLYCVQIYFCCYFRRFFVTSKCENDLNTNRKPIQLANVKWVACHFQSFYSFNFHHLNPANSLVVVFFFFFFCKYLRFMSRMRFACFCFVWSVHNETSTFYFTLTKWIINCACSGTNHVNCFLSLFVSFCSTAVFSASRTIVDANKVNCKQSKAVFCCV